ncbi:alpha/beta hydrolase [Alisedimentitalea sp. MJ-SS2]|uniref:alpha/beta hydrolase n=1 Tax=Aliisedimentitalea sp. MJ-SS2 TaxID=3049795 RepID=UPI00290AAC72|nr:alpha/beta hydrolase [Alisedimentitalea sp. MJ-SS2]MDU8926619.1 alpha/beta hydrolase [Alisedimentitalea sp. MJ-SS2]
MLKTLSFALFIALGGIFAFDRLEREMVYPFDATRVDPRDIGLKLDEEIFESGGKRLVLWRRSAQPGKPTILYFHGNAGNLAARAGRFQRFLERGYGLVALAYRGSSGSEGSPSEKYLAFDAARLLKRMGNYASGQVIIYGESLGSAVALAAIDRAGTQPDALVLEAPFTTVREVALTAYPQLEPLIDRMKSKWNSLARISETTAPLLILHGARDELIPIDMGRQLFAAAPSTEKRLLEVEGGHHTDLWRSDVLPVLWRFIDKRR